MIQERPTLYTKRFEIASNQNHDYFFCPDDDLFLSERQISTLIAHVKNDPSVPHGMAGQIKTFVDQSTALCSGVFGIDCEVEILNRSYFFTKAHVTKMLELSTLIGLPSINEARFMDDVLLSFSGTGLPRCHDIGPVDDCETSHVPGIATWKEDGFENFRLNGFLKLTQIIGANNRCSIKPRRLD